MPKKKIKHTQGVQGKIESYFARHVSQNSFFHACIGVGIGALLTNTVFDPHPVRWAIAFFAVGLFGHWWAWKNR